MNFVRTAVWLWAVSLLLAKSAADPIFSGPQPGEKITGFKVLPITGEQKSERDPIAGNAGRPLTLVFVHAIERSLVPLLRVIDEYGAQRKEQMRTEIVFLASDRISGEQRIRAAANSLRLNANVGLSLDGPEGPGNYGLNKECMMTILMAKDDKVSANFALVQPGIADAPKVIEAMAQVSGDAQPPTFEQLAQKNPRMAMRGEREKRAAQDSSRPQKDPFPGAVPTDERLVGLLRQFIRPTNDEAAVDRVLNQVKERIKDQPDLRQQAIDGWTRVLHFGDRYGTPYARAKGAEFLAALRQEAAAAPDAKK